MSMLAALVDAYGRLPGAAPFGFSMEKVGAAILLRPDGSPARAVDLRDDSKKRAPASMLVPQPVKRTVAIAPNFLWDKTAYALGVTAGEGKRTAQEHEAFEERHRAWLAGTDDAGLLALLAFLDAWHPEAWPTLGASDDLRDQNVVFAMEADWRADTRLAANYQRFLSDMQVAPDSPGSSATCRSSRPSASARTSLRPWPGPGCARSSPAPPTR